MKKFLVLICCLSCFFSLPTWALETYQQSCHILGEDDYVKYAIETENGAQKNSIFNLKLTAFEDENCEIPYLQYNQYFEVIELKSEKLNLKTYKITYTALSEEVARALNLIQYCGIQDWQNHVEQGVTGKVCDDYLQLSAGDTLFQILRKTPEGLHFGKTSITQDGRSERSRPIEFDPFLFHLLPLKP